MRIVTGTVVDGHVVLSGPLPEGVGVTVIVSDSRAPVRISLKVQAELEAAAAEAKRNEGSSVLGALD